MILSKPIAISLSEANLFDEKWLFELKVDGSRLQWDGKDLISDRNIIRNDRFPQVYEEIQQINCKVVGEIALPEIDSNVIQLNKKENWYRAKLFIFDIFELNENSTQSLSQKEKKSLIVSLVKNQFQHLTYPMDFPDFNTGWKFVNENKCEGLVIKFKSQSFKIKKMIEEKLKILRHEPGSQKGSFWLDRNGIECKCTGRSVAFVNKYKDLLLKKVDIFAEIDYLFLTTDQKPFIPRLRRIGTLEELDNK